MTAKNIYFEKIREGVLCKAAESFKAEIHKTNEEEEAKTVKTLVLDGVSLSICVLCCFYSALASLFVNYSDLLNKYY